MMRTTSLLALAAAAGLFATSASAADLGGNCCADLEERVAELEATTARKGNRKVSLEVSGWVHQGIMWFDGVSGNDTAGAATTSESNTYVGINRPEANSRFRFVGKAAISPKMNAGYLMELQVNTSNADNFSGANDDGVSATSVNTVSIRHSAWWIDHKEMGKLWVGQTSQATDAITEIQLSNTGFFANQNATAGGAFRTVSSASTAGPQLFNFMGGNSTDSSQIGEGNRRNVVKYESPTLAGFQLQVSAGEDDIWDVALRYAGEHQGFKLAFGIGYESTTDGPQSAGSGSERNCVSGVALGRSDVKCQQFGLSGSVMHMATGLFLNGHYGWREDDNAAKTAATANLDDTSTRWGLMAGIEKNWFGIGKTTLYGEYADWDIGQTSAQTANLEMTMWGFGINQSIEAAAMDIYLQYRNFGDMSSRTNAGVVTTFSDIDMIMAGAIIRF